MNHHGYKGALAAGLIAGVAVGYLLNTRPAHRAMRQGAKVCQQGYDHVRKMF